MPEISIKAETLFHLGDFAVSNSLLLSAFVFLFFIFLFVSYYRASKTEEKSGLYYILNMVLRALYNLYSSVVHDKIDVFFPLLSGFFIWILIQNWSGLLPGVGSITFKEGLKQVPLLRGNNADINATLAIALITATMTQVFGVQFLGWAYVKKFINFSNPINFFLGILDIMSEISKVLSFAFRLFGNIFAGEVLMTIVAFLVPILASFPFLILEVFVGFVQALVFSLLTSVFFSLAVSHH